MNTVAYKGNDKLLFGIILGVLAFWLFAQTTLNINVVMAKDLQMDTAMMNIAVSITSLFSGIFIVVAGGLADRLGRVKIIRIGFIFSIIGSLLVALTPTGTMASLVLIAGRIFQGLSGACIMPASLALLKAYWNGESRQRAISLWSIGSWGGSGFCALFGGLMAQNVGWRYIFFASALISVIGMWMIRDTPESKVPQSRENKGLDVAGIITFMIVMIALQVLVSQGSQLGWTSMVSIILAGAIIVFGIAFFRIEKSRKAPLIDFTLFKNSTYSGATISNFLLNGVVGMLIVSLMLLQLGAGLSSQSAGLLTLGYAVAIVAFIRVGEKLLRRFGPRKPMIWGCLIVGLSIVLLLPANLWQVPTRSWQLFHIRFLVWVLLFMPPLQRMQLSLIYLKNSQVRARESIKWLLRLELLLEWPFPPEFLLGYLLLTRRLVFLTMLLSLREDRTMLPFAREP
jgi:MFS transporter, DHA2 family, multidrug resistance protein